MALGPTTRGFVTQHTGLIINPDDPFIGYGAALTWGNNSPDFNNHGAGTMMSDEHSGPHPGGNFDRCWFRWVSGAYPVVGDTIRGLGGPNGSPVTPHLRPITAFVDGSAMNPLKPINVPDAGNSIELEYTVQLLEFFPTGGTGFRFAPVYLEVPTGTLFQSFKTAKGPPDSPDINGCDAGVLWPGVPGRGLDFNTQYNAHWHCNVTNIVGGPIPSYNDPDRMVHWGVDGVGNMYADINHPNLGTNATQIRIAKFGGSDPQVGDVIVWDSDPNVHRQIVSFASQVPPDQDGVYVSPEGIASNERYSQRYIDGDHTGLVWKSINNRTDFTVPCKWKFRFKMSSVTDPVGNYNQNPLGEWLPMTGTFGRWDLYVTKDAGPELLIGAIFVPITKAGWIEPPYFTPYHENFVAVEAGHPASNNPWDMRLSGFRVRDASGRWHVILGWRLHEVGHVNGDPAHGWTARHAGQVTHLVGHDTDVLERIDSKILSELTYETTAGVPITYNLTMTTTAGAASYWGPLFGTGYPFVQQEASRGFYLLFPGATGACCVYTAPCAGLYTFGGAFGRANTEALGDPVTVSVETAGTTLLSDTITNVHGPNVDPENPFGSTSTGVVNFNTTVQLAAGEVVRFVARGTNVVPPYDATAFQLTAVNYMEITEPPPPPPAPPTGPLDWFPQRRTRPGQSRRLPPRGMRRAS